MSTYPWNALAAVVTLLLAARAGAAPACPLIDATAPLTAAATASAGKSDEEQLAVYRKAILDTWPELYTSAVLGLRPGPEMDQRILASLAAVRSGGNHEDLKQSLRAQITSTSAAFQVFGDFQCNFTIYFADSLGELDGAGRIVAGRPALVLGVDTLAREQSELSLPVFFTHEFFHRYHFEASGFSDDLAERQQIWRSLWAEGLATWMSEQLTPGATRAEALMLPTDLEDRARPFTSPMATELLAGLTHIDAQLFKVYFTANPRTDRHGLPPRGGYYMGYLVAQRLSHHHTLAQLAHLKGPPLEREIAAALKALARDQSCRIRCINCTDTEPSPTAAATRLALPLRTSPTAKTPGIVVSRSNGGLDSGHPLGRLPST